MSFSVGIIGLPNVGKSTLFKALTGQEVKIESRPFTTIQPNKGIVDLPDTRLEKIAKIVMPEKKTLTGIEFVDIAGLVKNAWQGQGLGNQFLGQIRSCQALIEVVRCFKDLTVEHIEKTIDPDRDMGIIETELLMKDLETVDRALGKDKQSENIRLLEQLKQGLGKGKRISSIELNQEEKAEIQGFQFLTEKPVVFVLNTEEENIMPKKKLPFLVDLNLKLEQEIAELTAQEKKELEVKSGLDKLILACYKALDLITFYTIAGGKETRAWTVENGALAPQAGGVVHSDFEKKFIRAQVISGEKLIEVGDWKSASQKGLINTVGKKYKVQDGDVIEYRI